MRELVTRHIHSSGRFDRPREAIDADLDRWTPHADVITMTEIADPQRAAALERPGWDHRRGIGNPATRECAILWRADAFTLVAGAVVPLTKATGNARLSWPLCATTVVLRDNTTGGTILLSVAHLPAHVEGRTGWRAIPARIRIYTEAVRGWRTHIEAMRTQHKPDGTWAGGDWNINTRRPIFRAWLKHQWRGTGLRAVFPDHGTHGTRPIDGGMTDMDVEDGPDAITAEASDHKAVRETLTAPIRKEPTVPTPIRPPAPPYVGPAKFHGGSDNKPITRVVIHCTVSPCVEGGADATARYFRESVTRPSSAHYVVDPGATRQVVYDSVEAYHAPPNRGSIGVELCDPQTGPETRWADDAHEAMLRRAARLVARLCLANGVPITKLGPADLLAGKHGICGHVDVSNAWHQTTHTDPGAGFPWPHFMQLVNDAAAKIKEKHS